MRKIPTSMATQHPDNAGKPFFISKAFISAKDEVKESHLCFSDFDIDEYNWDWEGKFVDEAVVDRLLHKHLHYFETHPIGRDKFLTFRIPNPRVEKQFRLARAFMVMITSSQLAQSLGFNHPPIFETILPLTESAEELIEIQEAFRDLVNIDNRLLNMQDSIQYIELIPLFEQVDKIVNSAKLLSKYIKLHKKSFGHKPSYIRPYCARSDPALNSGMIPTVLALKIALSTYSELEKIEDVRLYPMLGTGSLPFRGGVSPTDIGKSLDEYSGVRTLTLQSAFRYDYPVSDVKKAIRRLKDELPRREPMKVDRSDERKIIDAIPFFEKPYRHTIEVLAPLINNVSLCVAKRRERMQHIGLFGYSRGIGSIRLPRAIPFTASLYSLGIPPELIGAGRGIKEAKKRGLWEIIGKYYIHLKDDLARSGFFLNKENCRLIAKEKHFCYDIEEDIEEVEKTFRMELGPVTSSHREHAKMTQEILKRFKTGKKISQLITYTGKLRKSLG